MQDKQTIILQCIKCYTVYHPTKDRERLLNLLCAKDDCKGELSMIMTEIMEELSMVMTEIMDGKIK